jgi:hypothetical protein
MIRAGSSNPMHLEGSSTYNTVSIVLVLVLYCKGKVGLKCWLG